MAKDKKGSKEAAQEQKAPEQARHSAKERPRLRTKFEKEVAPALLKELELKNVMAVPRIHKIVVNMGVGEATQNAKIIDPAVNELGQITGQKPVFTRAKKSISSSTRSSRRSRTKRRRAPAWPRAHGGRLP